MFKTLLGTLAIFAAVIGLALKAIGADNDSSLWVLTPLGIAAVAGIAWAVLSAREIARFATSRSARYGVNLFAISMIIGFIVVMLNVVVTTHTTQWDLTSNQRLSLAPQSRSVAESLPEDVLVTLIMPEGDSVSMVESLFRNKMEQYRAASGKIAFRVFDARLHPEEADSLPRPIAYQDIFVERGERVERVDDYNLGNLEEKITRALIAVTREEKRVVYFVTRDEDELFFEPSRNDPSSLQRYGLNGLRDSIEQEQFEVETIDLLEAQEVPEDCSLLIIADPMYQMTPGDLAVLTQHINQGGQVLIGLESESALNGAADSPLLAYLTQFGCQVGDNIVFGSTITDVSLSGQIQMAYSPKIYAGMFSRTHEITQELRQRVEIEYARSLSIDTLPRGVDGEALIQSNPDSFTLDLSALRTQSPQIPESEDAFGSVTLAAHLDVDVNTHPARYEVPQATRPDGAPDTLRLTRPAASPEPEERAAPAAPLSISDIEAELGVSLDDLEDLDPGGAVQSEPTPIDSEGFELEDAPPPAAPEQESLPHARLIVLSDTTMMANWQMAPGVSGNRDFVLNCVAFLTSEADLISVRPVDSINTGFTLSKTGLRFLLILMISLPVGVALCGVIVGVRRRRHA